MKPEKDDEREQSPEIPHAAEQKRQKAGGDIAQKGAEPKIFGERQHDREAANTYAVIVIKGTYMPSVSMTTASAHATAEKPRCGKNDFS